MAKPAITKRTTKGAALTYSELDTNFQNLADATVTLTAGTGGTQVTADLNGNITVVAGTNITVTGDNTTKTITINSTGGGVGLTNPLNEDIDLNGYRIENSLNTDIVIDPSPTTNTNPGKLQVLGDMIVGDGVAGAGISANTNTLTLSGPLTSFPNAGAITLGSNVQIDIFARGISLVGPTSCSNTFRLNTYTTVQRNALTASNGMLIYNSTDLKIQGYANGVWVDLH